MGVDELRPRSDLGRVDVSRINLRSRFAIRFATVRDTEGQVFRRGEVRDAFNSPFHPFVLATTSVGQEGLDFHTWCHAVWHWNLPTNPVDLEQREGRVHRYKGHAIRKNVAERFGLAALRRSWTGGDPWRELFRLATVTRDPDTNDLVPFWMYDEGNARVERRVPLLPFSEEVSRLGRLKSSLAVYRMVFGQPRQEDLIAYLSGTGVADRDARPTDEKSDVGPAGDGGDGKKDLSEYRISLAPPMGGGLGAAGFVAAGGRPGALRGVSAEIREMLVRLSELFEQVVPGYELSATDHYLGPTRHGRSDNFVVFRPRKYGVRLDARLPANASVIDRLREQGIDVYDHRPGYSGPGVYPVRLAPEDLDRHEDLVVKLLEAARSYARL